MPIMRSLSSDYRLQGLSVEEIVDDFEGATKAISRACEFNGRKLKPGPLLNAIVLHFLSLGVDEQKRFACRWVPQLEALLAETDEERSLAAERLDAASTEANKTSPRRRPDLQGQPVDPENGKPEGQSGKRSRRA